MSSLLSFGDNKWTKTCLIVSGCALVGISAFSLYYYYQNKRRMVDEGFEDICIADDSTKKILVLGLDGAGKSTFLAQLLKAENVCTKPETSAKTSNVVSVQGKNGKTLNFSEIGGSEEIRVYWSNFVQDTDLLIYIVDSTDDHRLAESVKELRILSACDKLKKLPIIILANKQDLKNATSSDSIGAAFGIPELSRQNKIAVYPLQMPPDLEECNKSVIAVRDIVMKLCFKD